MLLHLRIHLVFLVLLVNDAVSGQTFGSSRKGLNTFSFIDVWHRFQVELKTIEKEIKQQGGGQLIRRPQTKSRTSTAGGDTTGPVPVPGTKSQSSTNTGSILTPTGIPGKSTTSTTGGLSTTGSGNGTTTVAGNTTTSTASQAPSTTVGTPIAGVPALSTNCPFGYKYVTWLDDFSTYDNSKWVWQDGGKEQSTFDENGLTMSINQTAYNVAYQSTPQWVAPVQMAVSVKSSVAPGVVSSVTFRNGCSEGTLSCSDEIDLELIAKTYQLPLWQVNGTGTVIQLDPTRDVIETHAGTTTKERNWVYTGPTMPYDNVHEWVVNWDTDAINWYVDKAWMVQFQRQASGQLWPTQPLHVRFGLWGVQDGATWAEGAADWKTYPNPTQQISKITVTGCMKQ